MLFVTLSEFREQHERLQFILFYLVRWGQSILFPMLIVAYIETVPSIVYVGLTSFALMVGVIRKFVAWRYLRDHPMAPLPESDDGEGGEVDVPLYYMGEHDVFEKAAEDAIVGNVIKCKDFDWVIVESSPPKEARASKEGELDIRLGWIYTDLYYAYQEVMFNLSMIALLISLTFSLLLSFPPGGIVYRPAASKGLRLGVGAGILVAFLALSLMQIFKGNRGFAINRDMPYYSATRDAFVRLAKKRQATGSTTNTNVQSLVMSVSYMYVILMCSLASFILNLVTLISVSVGGGGSFMSYVMRFTSASVLMLLYALLGVFVVRPHDVNFVVHTKIVGKRMMLKEIESVNVYVFMMMMIMVGAICYMCGILLLDNVGFVIVPFIFSILVTGWMISMACSSERIEHTS